MTRDYRDYVQDILTCIQETEDFTQGMSFDEFVNDRKTRNAVIRSLEVLGEAVKSVPDDIRAQAPNVPWKRMAGTRDKLIHGYFGVDFAIVWVVITEELPPFAPRVRKSFTPDRGIFIARGPYFPSSFVRFVSFVVEKKNNGVRIASDAVVVFVPAVT